MRHVTFFDTALRQDRVLVSAGLAAIVALSWAYMVYLAQGMGDMDTAMAMPLRESWNTVDLATLFLMWVVMMIAMMVPTAAPMILTVVTVNESRRAQGRPVIPTGAFLLGYVVVWSGFAALATGVQWGLHSAALLSPMMASTNHVLGGLLLLAAGGFQLSPIKYTCLSQCRSPMGFLMSEWRDGSGGALTMGLRHGAFCLGCCWALMALLFVLGVMNLLWIGALAAFVLVEKVVPGGHWIARLTGVALIGWSGFMLAGATG